MTFPAAPEALVSFGGNVGDVRATLDRAVDMFCDGRNVRLLARSADYRTPPWGIEDQPPFINLCVAVHSLVEPRALLDRALDVEAAFGRNRSSERRWGPRALDIDLLAFHDRAVCEPGLVLPHPRLFERAFVLVPLAEIRPDAVIAGVGVKQALAGCDQRGIERLPSRSAASGMPG